MVIKTMMFCGYVINRCINSFTLRYKKVKYNNIRINGKMVICGKGNIIIGNNVKINSSLRSNPIGGQEYTLFSVSEGAKLEIGNNSGLSNTTIVCREKIEIGENVKVGGNTKIYDTDFHNLNYEMRINPKTDLSVNKPIKINDGVFIGAHVLILKGVTIGEKSIIAAGSVVTKDIPPNEIWGGAPAKFIRKLNQEGYYDN